jgi:hypothetical protein
MQRLEVLRELTIGLVVAYGGGTGFDLLYEMAFDSDVAAGLLPLCPDCFVDGCEGRLHELAPAFDGLDRVQCSRCHKVLVY